ncbi:hypothetical protein glysoja_038837 [Glycine soja]|uniref:Uncharacterized protein n=1 Tax=Glycine soja TaxID=3848 RepID=A0A0B2R3I7_GLYSO|nr:hypothetical protein glysoja_038837 [Glycine soja]
MGSNNKKSNSTSEEQTLISDDSLKPLNKKQYRIMPTQTLGTKRGIEPQPNPNSNLRLRPLVRLAPAATHCRSSTLACSRTWPWCPSQRGSHRGKTDLKVTRWFE